MTSSPHPDPHHADAHAPGSHAPGSHADGSHAGGSHHGDDPAGELHGLQAHAGGRRSGLLVLGGTALAATAAVALLATATLSVSDRLPLHPMQTLAPILAPVLPALAPAPPAAVPAAVPAPAPAPVAAAPSIFVGAFASEGKQAPLPAGEWVVMGRAVSAVGPLVAQRHAPVVSTTLLHLRGSRVVGGVLLQVNPDGAPSNWGVAGGCERPDFPGAVVRYVSDHNSGCSYVAFVTPSAASLPPTDASWHDAVEQALDNGWSLPDQWLESVYRLTDPLDAMQVHYLFDPASGAPPGRGATAEQVAALVAWTAVSWRGVQRGFRDRLIPGAGTALADWTSFRVLQEAAALPERPTASDRATVMGYSYRVVDALTGFGVSYLYLRSAVMAGALSLLQAGANGAMSYVQERVWDTTALELGDLRYLPGPGLEQGSPVVP